jgi:hypothetical protein
VGDDLGFRRRPRAVGRDLAAQLAQRNNSARAEVVLYDAPVDSLALMKLLSLYHRSATAEGITCKGIV